MAEPTEFEGVNIRLAPPPGSENVSPLPIFRNGVCCVSAWQLDADELAEAIKTGRVFVSVMSGGTQPPVYVGSEQSVRDMCADYGVWKR